MIPPKHTEYIPHSLIIRIAPHNRIYTKISLKDGSVWYTKMGIITDSNGLVSHFEATPQHDYILYAVVFLTIAPLLGVVIFQMIEFLSLYIVSVISLQIVKLEENHRKSLL